MDQFYLEEENAANSDCFFTKLLRECSMDCDQGELGGLGGCERDGVEDEAKRSKEEEKMPVEEFMRWKGLEDSDEEQTYEPEPQLVRAQSLRLQQQRKISTFIHVFGKNGIDPITGHIKTFSPQKHKKIMKGKR